jgi:signal transduction histidine kinase/CheY-like chemotaxis protein
MLSEIDSFNKTLRRTVFFITFVGILTSTFLATFVFKTLSKRINVTAQYIVNMKANLVQERLVLQNSQLIYLSRIKMTSGSQELKNISKFQLLDRVKKEQLGLYWIPSSVLKQNIQAVAIEKIFEATQYSPNQHLQIQSSIKKILKEKIKQIDNKQGTTYLDSTSISNLETESKQMLLMFQPVYKNDKTSSLDGVLVNILDLNQLFLTEERNVGFSDLFGFMDPPERKNYFFHQITFDNQAYITHSDEGYYSFFQNAFSKKLITYVNSEFRFNNANVAIRNSGFFIINPLKISFFIFFLGITFFGLLAFLIIRGIKLQHQTNLETNYRKNQIEKSHFFDTLAHELRTPLNGVLGMANLLLKSKLEPSQLHYLSAIKQSGYLMNLMVDQTLTASRMETYDIKIVNDTFIFNELLEQMMDALGPLADLKKLDFSYDLPKSMNGVTFLGDELRLRQVLINLLGNAIKFTEEGYVRLTISQEHHHEDPLQPWIRFEVSDSGIGLSKEDRNTLFKKFGRINKSKLTSASEGGLGLYISQKIIRLMGGNLELESTPQLGSNFYFKIQMKIQNQPIFANSQLSTLTDKHIVILGNQNHEDTLQFKDQLEKRGAIVDGFENYIAIKKYFLAQKRKSLIPDLIYIHHHVGDVEGINYFNDIQQWFNLDLSSRIIYLYTSTKSINRFHIISSGIQHTQLTPVESKYLVIQAEKVLESNQKKLPKKLITQSSQLQDSIFENNLHILIADDNLLNLEILSIMLQNLGHQVSMVKNAVEVLNALEQDTFDLILMDINMPELNGIEATMQIRQMNKPYQHIPIIAMSANIGDKFSTLCLENGMNAYLAKPIEIETLDRKIMEILLYPQGS